MRGDRRALAHLFLDLEADTTPWDHLEGGTLYERGMFTLYSFLKLHEITTAGGLCLLIAIKYFYSRI